MATTPDSGSNNSTIQTHLIRHNPRNRGHGLLLQGFGSTVRGRGPHLRGFDATEPNRRSGSYPRCDSAAKVNSCSHRAVFEPPFAGKARTYEALTQQNPTVGAGHTRDAILQLK